MMQPNDETANTTENSGHAGRVLNHHSFIVAYDTNRGEPRRKRKRSEADAAADCDDCSRCIVVCPTGIDIRNRLQLEWVNCTQCIDACNNVMDRVGKSRRLVRYSPQDAWGGKQHRMMGWRTVAFPMLRVAIAVAFLIVLTTQFLFDVEIAHAHGNPFQQISPGVITNDFSSRLTNRTNDPRKYTIAISEPSGATLLGMGDEPLLLKGNDGQRLPIVVEIAATEIGPDGRENGVLRILDGIGNQRELKMSIMGPRL